VSGPARPLPTTATKTPKPIAIPSISGIVARRPCVAAAENTMTLFGPGVAEATKAKTKKGRSDAYMPQAASYHFAEEGWVRALNGSQHLRSARVAPRNPANRFRNRKFRSHAERGPG
jgi:hypothetical protein